MSDLIYKEDAIDTVEELNRKVNDGRENDTICTSDVLRRINALPSADAVEVVRCKDCKWREHLGCALRIVDDSDKPKDDDFCSFGERREP